MAKTSVATGSLPRPRIPVEYGAKVPQNQRQRYLDRIIDEYLRLCSSQKEAFEKVDSTVKNKTVELCHWEVKQEKLVSNKLIKVKFPPWRDNKLTFVAKIWYHTYLLRLKFQP